MLNLPHKKTRDKVLSINIQQPVKIVHFQEVDSLVDFMDGQEMGGSLHILLLKTQLLGKGFHCPHPRLVSNCKGESNTIGGSYITGRISVPYHHWFLQYVLLLCPRLVSIS